MSDDLDRRLGDLAARFDAEIDRLDEAIRAKRPHAADRTSPAPAPKRSGLLEKLRPSPEVSPRDAVRERLAKLGAFRRAVLRGAEQEVRNADEWERRAKLCVTAGDDALAREALERRREHLEKATDFDVRAKQVEATLQALQVGLEEIERARRPR